jgi:hypothetical protein
MLPPTASFNASWFIDENLVPLIQKFFSAEWNAGGKKLIVHIDNAPAHNSRVTQNLFGHKLLKRLPHPPYSHDISLSDFHLLGKVKRALIGREIPDEIDLLAAVTEILNSISDSEIGSNMLKSD